MSQADALVHVLDASAPDVRQQRAAVLRVLRQLGVGEAVLRRRTVEVWNKVDAVRVGCGGGDSDEEARGDRGGVRNGGGGDGSRGEGAQRDGVRVAAGEVGFEGQGGRRRPGGMRHGVEEVAGDMAVQLDGVGGSRDVEGWVRDRPGRSGKRTRDKGSGRAELEVQVEGEGVGTSTELEAARDRTLGLASGSATRGDTPLGAAQRRRRLFQVVEEEHGGAEKLELDDAEDEGGKAGLAAGEPCGDAGGEDSREAEEEDQVQGGPSQGCFGATECLSHSNGSGAGTQPLHQPWQEQQQEPPPPQQQVGRPGEPGGGHGGVMGAGGDGVEDALWASKLRTAAGVVKRVHGSGAGEWQGRGRGEREGDGEEEGAGGGLPAAVVLAAVGKGEGLDEVRWALAGVLQGRGRSHAGGTWRMVGPGDDGGALGCGGEQPSRSSRPRSELPAKGQHGRGVTVAIASGQEHPGGEHASGTAGVPPLCAIRERLRGRWLTPTLWVSDKGP